MFLLFFAIAFINITQQLIVVDAVNNCFYGFVSQFYYFSQHQKNLLLIVFVRTQLNLLYCWQYNLILYLVFYLKPNRQKRSKVKLSVKPKSPPIVSKVANCGLFFETFVLVVFSTLFLRFLGLLALLTLLTSLAS